MSITSIGEESANDTGGNLTAEDFERFNVGGLTYVKTHPTTAVGGTPVALRYFPGDPDEDNLDYGFAGVVLDDPFISLDGDDLEGSVIFENATGTGDDYKVVNMDDPATDEVAGAGVTFDSNLFKGEAVDEFEEDRIVLKLTGNAGRSATCALDVCGLGNADVIRTEDGQPEINPDTGWPTTNNSLIERFDDTDDGDWVPPRFARDTQLRPDLIESRSVQKHDEELPPVGETEAKDVVFMVQRLADLREDYDGDSYWSTVLVEDEEAESGFADLEPTDEFEPNMALQLRTGWVEAYPNEERVKELRDEQGVSAE